MAVAALAVFAVAAVMLLAGGGSAQADTAATIAPDTGGGHLLPMATDPTPTPTRVNATPEPCADAAASTVDSGQIALFDVYWNPDEGELTNNPCPPTVTHVPAGEDDDGNTTPARDDREASSINIDETVVHIPNSAKIDLSAPGTPYPKDKYKKLWDADDTATPGGVGDRMVWALPACPDSPATASLCLSFSADLLNAADWNGNIVYHVTHVHQVDIDKQDARYVLVYDGTARAPVLEWDSSNAMSDQMPVPVGGYDRPTWFFTSRGTYEFQVYITGTPNKTAAADRPDGLDPIADEDSVSSDVREYIIHVGAEPDLSVGVTAAPETASPAQDVTITITASNAGPDEAEETHVDVALPAGLTYKSHNTATGTYDSGTGLWDIGDLAVTNATNAPTLTLTATVAEGTKGTEQQITATISATETVTTTNDTYEVPVLDPNGGNNMGMATVTVPAMSNTDPMFMVVRSVPENSAPGTLVGDPIAVMEPDSGDTLTPSLSGVGADQFTATSVSGGIQIAVANGATLDYETTPSYKLTLGVSDGKDANGNADTTVDDTIPVLINVTDVDEPFSATLTVDNDSPTVGQTVTFTVALHNRPDTTADLHHLITAREGGTEVERVGGSGEIPTFTRTKTTAGTYQYRVGFWTWDSSGNRIDISSNTVTVTWSAASN